MDNNKITQTGSNLQKYLAKMFKPAMITLTILLLVLGGWKLFSKNNAGSQVSNNHTTRPVHRGDLTINVCESGNLRARKAIEVRSDVDSMVAILSIVPEGTYITPEDVKKGKILVELDSSGLREELSQRKMDFDSAASTLSESQGSYDIQVKQNESDLSAAKLREKFALMDFRRYLGQKVADKVIADSNQMIDSEEKISELIKSPDLGGAALQQLKTLNDEIDLAQEKYLRAQDKLKWTQKLSEKNYVSTTELQSDQLSLKSLTVQRENAETSLKLFELYEFPKELQRLLNECLESKREMERTLDRANSKLAQENAKLKNARSSYSSRKQRVEKKAATVASCKIKAPAPGLVVYAVNERYGRREGPLEPGLVIHERQVLMTLPDTAEMVVRINIHESSVAKVKVGQKANIIIDAFPDKTFTGEVLSVSVLPNQEENWLNPDLKVYSTDISIDGAYDFLRPGMSARVEINVEQLKDALLVPVQSVANRKGKKICYVQTADGTKETEVQTGSFNDIFVQITQGIEEGQQVLLNPPLIIQPQNDIAPPQEEKPSSKTDPASVAQNVKMTDADSSQTPQTPQTQQPQGTGNAKKNRK